MFLSSIYYNVARTDLFYTVAKRKRPLHFKHKRRAKLAVPLSFITFADAFAPGRTFPRTTPPGLSAADPDSLWVRSTVLFPFIAILNSRVFYHRTGTIVKPWQEI